MEVLLFQANAELAVELTPKHITYNYEHRTCIVEHDCTQCFICSLLTISKQMVPRDSPKKWEGTETHFGFIFQTHHQIPKYLSLAKLQHLRNLNLGSSKCQANPQCEHCNFRKPSSLKFQNSQNRNTWIRMLENRMYSLIMRNAKYHNVCHRVSHAIAMSMLWRKGISIKRQCFVVVCSFSAGHRQYMYGAQTLCRQLGTVRNIHWLCELCSKCCKLQSLENFQMGKCYVSSNRNIDHSLQQEKCHFQKTEMCWMQTIFKPMCEEAHCWRGSGGRLRLQKYRECFAPFRNCWANGWAQYMHRWGPDLFPEIRIAMCIAKCSFGLFDTPSFSNSRTTIVMWSASSCSNFLPNPSTPNPQHGHHTPYPVASHQSKPHYWLCMYFLTSWNKFQKQAVRRQHWIGSNIVCWIRVVWNMGVSSFTSTNHDVRIDPMLPTNGFCFKLISNIWKIHT